MAVVATLLFAALHYIPPADGETFDWDRYHARQDACRELGDPQRACATGGLGTCDRAVIDRLQRQCSAFGPLGRGEVGSGQFR
jgi:hypothetical protein